MHPVGRLLLRKKSMRPILNLPGLLAALLLTLSSVTQAASACPPLIHHTQLRLQDEKPVDLCGYAGKVLLVVNTASFCGYTSQYKSLETLNARYRSRGLVVLGFPSNDFGQQEPGSSADIAAFCENTFGVKFAMFAKSHVAPGAGRQLNPLFAGLAQRSGQAPRWNFHKYLINRQGDQVISHASKVDPEDPAFIRDLERLLGSK